MYKACGIKMEKSAPNELPTNGIPLEFNEIIDEDTNSNNINLDKGPEIEINENDEIEFEVLKMTLYFLK